MHPTTVAIFAIVCCCIAQAVIGYEDRLSSEENGSSLIDRSAVIQTEDEGIGNENGNGNGAAAGTTLKREKRTLLLKKKLIGAGLLGFGLGVAKGYKAGYYSAPPQVHRVYLSPPPATVKYVEYIEKPVFVERIIERPSPVFKPQYAEYKESAPYGPW